MNFEQQRRRAHFFKLFYRITLPELGNHVQAYEKAEELYHEEFGEKKYSNYGSFKSAATSHFKTKRGKKKK